MLIFSAFIIALVITVALIPPLMRVADRLSVLDTPNERKVHTGAIPRVGGMAMVVGACIPLLLWLPHTNTMNAFIVSLLVLLFFGAWDDSKDLDYRIKFLGQFLAVGIIVFWGDVQLAVLPFAGIDPVPVWVSLPVTVVFLVGVTNAVNLSDGLDGLAAGVSLLSLGAVSLLAQLAGGESIIVACFIVAGVIFGFLRYNTYPARIFMGDTGSQFLGFTLGVLAVILTQHVNTALNPLLPLFLVGLPVLDTLFVMGKRISEGRSPFAADKNHLHHRLLSLGMAHYEAVSVIYLSQLAFLVLAFMLRYQSDTVVLLSYLGLTGGLLAILLWLQGRGVSAGGWGQLTEKIAMSAGGERARDVAIAIIRCGVLAYLLMGAFLVSAVPRDIAFSSIVLFFILMVRLLWSARLRFLSLRLLVFPAMAFAVYLMHRDGPLTDLLPSYAYAILITALLLLMFIAIRSTKDPVFQTTPTDLLVVSLAGGVGVLYQQGMVEASLVPIVLGMVVLFYAGELVMRHMTAAWNCFTVGILGLLALLAVKGW